MLTIRIFWSKREEGKRGNFIVEAPSFSAIMELAHKELEQFQASMDDWAFA